MSKILNFPADNPNLSKQTKEKGEKHQAWSKVLKTWRLVKAKSSSFLILTLKSPLPKRNRKSSCLFFLPYILLYKVQSKNNNDQTGVFLTVLSNIVQQQNWSRQNAGVPSITWGPIGSLLLFFFFPNVSSIFHRHLLSISLITAR